ncbi:(2Fe-2S)-binding protein [Streptomyces sp. NPDC002952]|uniref:(2Fe-2S)-binding protein n=1 Tax=Streptomyces sp. NPDC002952 TaxID=3364673 RepID=UPI0036BF5696
MVLLLFVDLDSDLAALRTLGGFSVLRTGVPPGSLLPTLARAYAPPPDDGGSDVYGDPIIFRVRKVARSLRAPETRIVVSVAQQALAARLWSVSLGAAALYGALPDLEPRLLAWDPDASTPEELWLSEVRALPATALGEMVLDGHLVPLAAALRARYTVSARLLWGNAGAALAGAVRLLDRWARETGRPEAAERVRALAAPLLAHPDLSWTLAPGTLRRRSCCLYYRLPGGGLCGDCCFDRVPRTRAGSRTPRSSPGATSE